jgi:hypothetical protein
MLLTYKMKRPQLVKITDAFRRQQLLFVLYIICLFHSHTVQSSLWFVVRIRVRGSQSSKNSVRKEVYRVGTLGFVVCINIIISITKIQRYRGFKA